VPQLIARIGTAVVEVAVEGGDDEGGGDGGGDDDGDDDPLLELKDPLLEIDDEMLPDEEAKDEEFRPAEVKVLKVEGPMIEVLLELEPVLVPGNQNLGVSIARYGRFWGLEQCFTGGETIFQE
jgi:hypothetical protein